MKAVPFCLLFNHIFCDKEVAVAIVDTDWETLFVTIDGCCRVFSPALHARRLAQGVCNNAPISPT